MVFAVSGMHYTAMKGTYFFPLKLGQNTGTGTASIFRSGHSGHFGNNRNIAADGIGIGGTLVSGDGAGIRHDQGISGRD